MAKQRQANSLVSAIQSVTAALRLESIPNPTDEQKQQIHEAKCQAANVIDNSNFITAAEHGDDSIETTHQVDELLEQADINPVELRRNNALAGAKQVVAIEQAEQEQPEQLEQPE